MKYYNITLGKGPKGALLYPANYQEEVGDFAVDHLYYDVGKQSYLLLLIEEKNATNILREGIEEITEAAAHQLSGVHEQKVEVVKDEVKLRRIELKAQLGQILTTDESDAIDITKPNSVFATTTTLSDRINEK